MSGTTHSRGTRPRLHPFFDPRSLYRLQTEISLWHDDGRASVADYFEGRRVAGLREAWLNPGDPPAAQDWGLPAVLNAQIHEHLVRARTAQERPMQLAAKGEAAALAADLMPAPAVLRFDLTDGDRPINAPDVERSPDWLFTGVGRRRPIDVSEFSVEIPGLTTGDRALALIVDRDLLERMAKKLGRKAPDDESAAVQLITDAIQPSRLGIDGDGAERAALDAASALSCTWAMAAGLSGMVRSDGAGGEGRFMASVKLAHKSPSLEPWTFLVVCTGPNVEQA